MLSKWRLRCILAPLEAVAHESLYIVIHWDSALRNFSWNSPWACQNDRPAKIGLSSGFGLGRSAAVPANATSFLADIF